MECLLAIFGESPEPEGPVSDDIKARIHKTFRPSEPVREPDLLYGRDEALKRTLGALAVPGRSVFIFGERGVGKTSLAQTSAFLFNTAETEPVLWSCHKNVSFSRLVTQITRKLMAAPIIQKRQKRVTEMRAGIAMANLLRRIETEADFTPSSIDVNEAVDLLNEATRGIDQSKPLVVVLDELDTVSDQQFRTDIAYFVKQLGDQECRVKFIFAGIGETVEDLLGKHESASRYLATINLERLPINILQQVLLRGFERIGGSIPEPISMRLACISDGFAYYTHLIGMHIALQTLADVPGRLDAGLKQYEAGLRAAVEDSEVWLKSAYDKAVKKYGDEYRLVLWSVADHWELERSTDHMYPTYQAICKKLGHEPVARKQYSAMLNRLKTAAHGNVLKSSRRSWYKFRETVLRGYCKMQAETQGIEVGIGYLQSKPSSTLTLR
jgi:Cdc6-like AAA superfamily ATPase